MRLAELYKKEIVSRLREKFTYSNLLAVPKIEKITVNVGVGRHAKDKQYIKNVVEDLRAITGQQPVLVKARKSISGFKVRQGDIVGICATLRNQKMYDFMEKLINVTLPRVRDFRGINPNKVDKGGNLSLGFREQVAFPEIRVDQVEETHGLEVNITTTAKSQVEGLELFKLLGFPFTTGK